MSQPEPQTMPSDLKLIDGLLCDLKWYLPGLAGWAEIERHTSATRKAMARLRQAIASGEVTWLTSGLYDYLHSTMKANDSNSPHQSGDLGNNPAR